MIREILYKIGGRKFIAFIIATILFFIDKIDAKMWLIAFSVYVGANAIDSLGKGSGSESNEGEG